MASAKKTAQNPIKKLALRKNSTRPAQLQDLGIRGAPIDRKSPFYFGFIATLGAVTALTLMRAMASLSQVFILLLSALFLAMGLNPSVEALRKRGLKRVQAVSVIFIGVLLFLAFFAIVIIPPLVSQGSSLVTNLPQLLESLKNNAFINDLNDRYGIVDQLSNRVTSLTSNGSLVISTFGGVVGVGRTVISGLFSAITILILTLYFITSLPQGVNLAMRFVPASRRDRVHKLTDAVIANVGTFVGSQILIAGLAALVIAATSAILGMPSPIAIGMTIFVVALVPLIGHYLGIAVTTIIGLTQSISVGLIAFVVYVLYVQIENYIITPRVMKRSLSVPGVITLISAMVGTSLLGLIGGLLAVPVAASIILILKEVVWPRMDKG